MSGDFHRRVGAAIRRFKSRGLDTDPEFHAALDPKGSLEVIDEQQLQTFITDLEEIQGWLMSKVAVANKNFHNDETKKTELFETLNEFNSLRLNNPLPHLVKFLNSCRQKYATNLPSAKIFGILFYPNSNFLPKEAENLPTEDLVVELSTVLSALRAAVKLSK